MAYRKYKRRASFPRQGFYRFKRTYGRVKTNVGGALINGAIILGYGMTRSWIANKLGKITGRSVESSLLDEAILGGVSGVASLIPRNPAKNTLKNISKIELYNAGQSLAYILKTKVSGNGSSSSPVYG